MCLRIILDQMCTIPVLKGWNSAKCIDFPATGDGKSLLIWMSCLQAETPGLELATSGYYIAHIVI